MRTLPTTICCGRLWFIASRKSFERAPSMLSGAFSGGLAAASVLAVFTLLGGPQVANFHAGPSAVHQHFAPYEWDEPAPSPPRRAAPSPEPERSEEPPTFLSGPSVASAVGALAGASGLVAGGRRISRRLRGKQLPTHREVGVQTSPFDREPSTSTPSAAASESSPSRVKKQHGRRA